MPLLSDIIDVDSAKSLFQGRRSSDAIANTEFHNGNHWQDSKQWIGAKPLIRSGGFSQTMAQIKEGFVSENVIKEVNNRHVSGVLGREPLWGFIPKSTTSSSVIGRRRRFAKLFNFIFSPTVQQAETNRFAQEADEALTVWWNERKPAEELSKALLTTLNEEKCLLRLYVPRGLRDENGEVPIKSNLVDALNLLYVDTANADRGGVFKDDLTQQEFAVYTTTQDDKAVAELNYVNKQGQTVSEFFTEDEDRGEPLLYDMQGRLWMHELVREPLISEQIRSNQRSLNLALTMMTRNVNLAGSLERTVMNAERPKETIRIPDPTQASGYREEQVNSEYLTGPGASMFLTGLLIRDDNGRIIGRANPNISFREPVAITSFTGTRDQFYASILGQVDQRHALISGDAVASGRSREQARGEFGGSLKPSKRITDDAGRWLLEAALRLAAQFCNRVNDFADLRCDFNSIIETGPIDASERQENRADVKDGLLSRESAMSRNGLEDTDAELQRIAEEKGTTPEMVPLPKPSNGDTEVIQ